jgi:hypothetical protein
MSETYSLQASVRKMKMMTRNKFSEWQRRPLGTFGGAFA